ncbi:hypothetical protein [Sporanaerobium hydrogeniformans]|uniref:hypothetical protein n=1 Tax=Sporanaerobium hydrogeniformans TaxID=3072179 RepID=UPI0015D4EC8F|nr:hypothetical protein [Sporanaerobium hydrogeniformans]
MGIFKKRMTGYTKSTMINRQTGAGAYFKNYNIETDTFSSAVEAGKLLGATQGGGTFTAKPTITPIEIDGVPSAAMGLEEVESWEVTMQATFIEVKPELITKVLGAATQVNAVNGKYKKIQGKMKIDLDDYENNITFLGDMVGYDDPVIIQVYNALSTDGLSMNPQDKKSSTISTTFKGHVSPIDYAVPPFAIFIPVKGATLVAEYAIGETTGTTKATVTAITGTSNTFKYIIGTEETEIIEVGEILTGGTTYTTNSDIEVSEGDVIYMFELDDTNKVVQFNMHTVAKEEIAAV